MKKRLSQTLWATSSLILGTLSLSSCTHYDLTLVVYNWEDYIFEGTDEYGNIEAKSTVDKFSDYYYETYGKTVYVSYETFSTPEDMYNQMNAGSIQPDLICPSDYRIQKMEAEGLLEKFDFDMETKEYEDKLSNFRDYGSPYI
jgi:spermidine/putrescine transport system substrate-binding protein